VSKKQIVTHRAFSISKWGCLKIQDRKMPDWNSTHRRCVFEFKRGCMHWGGGQCYRFNVYSWCEIWQISCWACWYTRCSLIKLSLSINQSIRIFEVAFTISTR